MDKLDPNKLQQIVNKYQEESDRACAVLGVATLDALLEGLLRRAMVTKVPKQLFEGTGAAATFSAKIDLAYSLGLITAEERSDLHILRRVRNDFAHAIQHELSFTTTEIADRIRSLSLCRLFEGQPILAGDNDTIRWRFEMCVGALITVITDLRIPNANQPSAPICLKRAAG